MIVITITVNEDLRSAMMMRGYKNTIYRSNAEQNWFHYFQFFAEISI